MVGTNTKEGNLYLAPGSVLGSSTDDDALTLDSRVHDDPAAALAAYGAVRPAGSASELRSASLADALLAGSARLADARPSAGRIRLLRLPLGGPRRAARCRAHRRAALRVRPRRPTVVARQHRPAPTRTPAPASPAIRMHRAWVGFARTTSRPDEAAAQRWSSPDRSSVTGQAPAPATTGRAPDQHQRARPHRTNPPGGAGRHVCLLRPGQWRIGSFCRQLAGGYRQTDDFPRALRAYPPGGGRGMTAATLPAAPAPSRVRRSIWSTPVLSPTQ